MKALRWPEAAAALWRRYGGTIRAHLDGLPPTARRGGSAWAVGGGTILAARWRHRQSFDIDISVTRTIPGGGTRAVVDDLAGALVKSGMTLKPEEVEGLLQLEAPEPNAYGGEAGIDIWTRAEEPARGTIIERLDGEPVPTLTSADILAGKLRREGAQLARDAYDIAHGYAADPAAVESAVNGTAPAHQRRVRVAWAAGSHAMGFDPNGIIAWSGKPAPVSTEHGWRAAEAVEKSRWIELTVTVDEGRVRTETRSAGERRRSWTEGNDACDMERCLAAIEEAGIGTYLRNHLRGTDWNLRSAGAEIRKAALAGGRARVVHVIERTRGDAPPAADGIVAVEIDDQGQGPRRAGRRR